MSDAQLNDDIERLRETVRWLIEDHGLMPVLRGLLEILGTIAYQMEAAPTDDE